ncbi:unnamed protein product [Durusdinium trenchii]|uniref:E3 ubiquitin-protein ligase ATL31 (Protein CARBON/NITROGEN INSENSITIVE 1) (Protein SUPER SURVIVAL 1) (RING-H2 finger protein ATL31) (RING-type E3 ubiquitin transferase ATL31) n=2 Tax=Durusdinium trenchii TaxID=1381693 RepID=A0ABP0M006_9DINO
MIGMLGYLVWRGHLNNPGQDDQASASRPGVGRDLEQGHIVPVPAQGRRGEAQYSIPRRIARFLCMYGRPERLQVHYSRRFKLFMAAISLMSLAWIVNFFVNVHPLLEDEKYITECRDQGNRLRYQARVLFIYFMWFVVARASLFVPCILSRVAIVQSRTHGFCRTYCVHLLIRDGPIYIYCVASVLFWFHLLQSPECESRNPDLYGQLKIYAVCSCLLAFMCIVEVHWHNKLIANTLDLFSVWIPEVSRRAPPETLEKLETIHYDPDAETNRFGDEEDKTYPSECAICLGSWEKDDVIKATPCGHAFHEDCIGGWLQSARTCALCRKDLVQLTNTRPEPESVGRDRGGGAVVVIAY